MKHATQNLMIISMAGMMMIFTSCSTITYTIKNKDQVANKLRHESEKLPFKMHPTDLDAPFPSERGEVYLNGNLGNSIGLAAGLALSDKTYMVARYSAFDASESGPSGSTYFDADYYYTDFNGTYYGDTTIQAYYQSDFYLTSGSFDLGFGRYKHLNKNFMSEFSFGGSTGKITNEFDYSILGDNVTFSEKRKYCSVFLQNDIGWVSKHFETSISGRFNSYFFMERSFKMEMAYDVSDYQKTAFSFEGAFRIALGWKFLKPYFEVAGTIPIASPEIEWMPVMVKGGLISRF